MTTAIFSASASIPNASLASSWHGQTKQREASNNNESNISEAPAFCAVTGLLKTSSAVSSDGYVRLLGAGNNPSDLNNNNSTSSSGINRNRSNESQDGQKQEQQNVQNPSMITKSKTSQVSILAGKYLLVPASSSNLQQRGSSDKSEFNCINIHTKEQYTCKIVPRNPKGLAMVAAYHRLEESSEFVNQIVEAILTPKMLYFILPRNYGNVHLYVLAKKSLKEPEAANIFKQMVSAVQHCHSKGVVLRDIKMGRFVFVDLDRTIVKLESLEDAVLLTDSNNDSLDDKHGCPNYVSPEKAEILIKKHTKYPGKATDIWSLGVILYTMLVGSYPFNDADNSKLFHKIRSGNFTIPQRLSGSASLLIKALLQKSPVGRPSCKDVLRCSWFKTHCVPTSQFLPSPTACSAWRSESDGNAEIIPVSRTLYEPTPDQVVPIQ